MNTHSLAKFLPDERFEDLPDHIEDEWLFDHMHFFQTKWHSVLNEGEQTETETWTESLHLFHSKSFEVHDDYDSFDLSFRFQNCSLVDEVEHTENLIGCYFRWIPQSCRKIICISLDIRIFQIFRYSNLYSQ